MNIQFLYEQNDYLVKCAVMRNMTEAQLVRELLTVIARDKMVDAVLDDLPDNAIVPEPKPTRVPTYMRRQDRAKLIVKMLGEQGRICIKDLDVDITSQAKWYPALVSLLVAGTIHKVPRIRGKTPQFYELRPVPVSEQPSPLPSPDAEAGPSTMSPTSPVEVPVLDIPSFLERNADADEAVSI